MRNEDIVMWSYGSGYGSGSGSGYGSGDGSGYGSGSGSGYGSGDGYGDGDGDGDGDGYKIINFCKNKVYYIDDIATVIKFIKGNFAKGFIIKEDFSTVPCYVAKDDFTGLFAHGETLKKAFAALQEKCYENMSVDERIDKFLAEFSHGKKYSGEIFYNWHHILTGSCEFGRKEFFKQVGAKFEDMFTVDEFIKLTENAYGGNIIKQLKQRWHNANKK